MPSCAKDDRRNWRSLHNLAVTMVTVFLFSFDSFHTVKAGDIGASGRQLPCFQLLNTSNTSGEIEYVSNACGANEVIVKYVLPRAVFSAMCLAVSLVLLCVVFPAVVCCCSSPKRKKHSRHNCRHTMKSREQAGESSLIPIDNPSSEKKKKKKCEQHTRRANDMKKKAPLWATMLIVGLATFAATILIFVGVPRVAEGVDTLYVNLVAGQTYFENVIQNVNSSTRDAKTGMSLLPADSFDGLQHQIDLFEEKYIIPTGEVNNDVKGVKVAIQVLSAMIVLLGLAATAVYLYLTRSHRGLCGLLLIIVCAVFQLCYISVGSLALAGKTAAVSPFCVEVDAQKTRSLGFFQQYAVPYCHANNPFEGIESTMKSTERTLVTETCSALNNICSPSSKYSILEATKLYKCDLTNCSTGNLRHLDGIIDKMEIKSGVPINFCSGSDAGGGGGLSKSCSIERCVKECTNPLARMFSQLTLEKYDDATRVYKAFNTAVKPLLSCNQLIDTILNITVEESCHGKEDDGGNNDDRFAAAVNIFAGGYLLAGFTFVIGGLALALMSRRRRTRSFSATNRNKKKKRMLADHEIGKKGWDDVDDDETSTSDEFTCSTSSGDDGGARKNNNNNNKTHEGYGSVGETIDSRRSSSTRKQQRGSTTRRNAVMMSAEEGREAEYLMLTPSTEPQR